MKTKAYREWTDGIKSLTRSQRKSAFSQGERLGRWGRQSGLQRFRCRDCGKCFNALTGTPLARLRRKECWLVYSQALIEGLTIRASAARSGVAKTTSFRWRHRFLTDLAELKATSLTGIVEADETYFPLSFKGSRHLPRPPHRRGHAIHHRGARASAGIGVA